MNKTPDITRFLKVVQFAKVQYEGRPILPPPPPIGSEILKSKMKDYLETNSKEK